METTKIVSNYNFPRTGSAECVKRALIIFARQRDSRSLIAGYNFPLPIIRISSTVYPMFCRRTNLWVYTGCSNELEKHEMLKEYLEIETSTKKTSKFIFLFLNNLFLLFFYLILNKIGPRFREMQLSRLV